jgi:hypothetical protein
MWSRSNERDQSDSQRAKCFALTRGWQTSFRIALKVAFWRKAATRNEGIYMLRDAVRGLGDRRTRPGAGLRYPAHCSIEHT